MVTTIRIALVVVAVLLLAGCAVSARQSPPDGSTANGLHITGIEITENGAASPAIDPLECHGFVLDEAAVRRALEESDPIDRDAYLLQLPWSPCLARGRLKLQDGRQGTWTVRQYGTGSVLFDGGAEWFFWCRTCTAPPFVAVE